jgi:hypothetical protein
MGLILDSSIVIAAERRGDTVVQLIQNIVKVAGDQEAALSAIGLTELVHGIYRAQTLEIRQRRESFINELLADLAVYPYTKETALLAGERPFTRLLSQIPLGTPGIGLSELHHRQTGNAMEVTGIRGQHL